jgi:hypothetical protein
MYAKLKYQLGLRAVPLVHRLWRKSIAAHSQRILLDRDIFLITSTITPSETPPASSARRSVFSAEERLDQTLGSIASVRAKVPDALIVLLDNSDLTAMHMRVLQDAVDWLVLFHHDPRSIRFRAHDNRGVGEVYMLRSMHDVLGGFRYRLLFKLSGRYQLSQQFSLEHFPQDRFGFLPRDGVASTRLYSVPFCFHNLYGRQLAAAFIAGRLGVSIESTITRGLTPFQVQWLDHLGVSGYMAGGLWLDE